MSGPQLPRETASSGRAPPVDRASVATVADGTPDTRLEVYRPRAADDLPEVFGRYRVIRRLGAGGMGAVYLAHDSQLDGPVALKVPHADCVQDDSAIERFYREARAAFALRRVPGVCQVRDVGQIDGRHYLALDYVAGEPVSAVARTLSIPDAVELVRRLAVTLHDAHANGVVHRDLKPSNVILDETGAPIVMDFGLARREGSNEPRLTHSGAVLGTPAYMPPEQVRGEWDQIGPRTDVYSLGMILYELLTRQLPFEGSVFQILGQILAVDPVRPSQINSEVDPELERICLTAIAKEANDRFATMAEFAVALARWLESPFIVEPPVTPKTGPPSDSARLPRKPASGRTSRDRRRLAPGEPVRIEQADAADLPRTPIRADTKPCPVCGETIKAVAVRCRYCRTDFAPVDDARGLRRTVVWLFLLSLTGCLAPLLVLLIPLIVFTRHRRLVSAGALYVVLAYTALAVSLAFAGLWAGVLLLE